MTRGTPPQSWPLDALRRVPFVRGIEYSLTRDRQDIGFGGKLDVRTPTRHFHLLAEARRSYLTRSEVNQLLAWVKQQGTAKPRQVILLARHIPRPVAERLIEAKVNFADDAGNIHLALGDRYNWTTFGKPALERPPDRRSVSPAQLQLLFQFATHPDSLNWPVRRLEEEAGMGKSTIAQARLQLAAAGLLVREGKKYRLGPPGLLEERLVSGYAEVLRPKLALGTFRPVEKTPEEFLARLRSKTPSGIRYALSGGPAAGLLQRFYRGPEVPMFLAPPSPDTARQLRLLPDSNGPVTLLRAFGEVVFGRIKSHHALAPPWLIYAELLAGDDPRAHEAAREFKKEFLP